LYGQCNYDTFVCFISDEDDEDVHVQPDKNEVQNALRTLSAKLEDLSTCNDLITKHGAALQRALSVLEQLDSSTDISQKVKAVNERATLFRITSNAMINVSLTEMSFKLVCVYAVLSIGICQSEFILQAISSTLH